MSDLAFQAVEIGSLLAFPAIAAWAVRVGGTQHLRIVSGAAVALAISLALLVASRGFGSRMSPVAGYVERAAYSLMLLGTTLAVPVIAVSRVVGRLSASRVPAPAVYVLGVAVAVLAWGAATVVAAFGVYLFAR